METNDNKNEISEYKEWCIFATILLVIFFVMALITIIIH